MSFLNTIFRPSRGAGRGAALLRALDGPRPGTSRAEATAQTEGRAVHHSGLPEQPRAGTDSAAPDDSLPIIWDDEITDLQREETRTAMEAPELSEMPPLAREDGSMVERDVRPREPIPASPWEAAAFAWESIPREMQQKILDIERPRPRAGAQNSTPSAPSDPNLASPVYPNQTNPFYPPQNSMNTTVRPQMMVFPDTSKLPSFSDDPKESWEAFIEEWEHLTRKYCWDNFQQAMCLPESLKGGARQDFFALIRQRPECKDDYKKLKWELTRKFTRNKPLKGRSLWSLSQGKRSVGSYYDEIVTLGRSVYSDMPDQYKDMVLRDAFLNGLKDSFQNVLLKKKIAKLEDAYREAQVLEYAEATKSEAAVKVAQVDSNDAMKNIEKDLAWVKSYVKDAKTRAADQRPSTTQGNWNGGRGGNSSRGGYNRGGYNRGGYGRGQGRGTGPGRNDITCWHCGKTGHIARDCRCSNQSGARANPPNNQGRGYARPPGLVQRPGNVRAVEADTTMMSDEEFATSLLTQPPEDQQVASVNATSTRGGGGRKLGVRNTLGILLGVLVCLIGSGEAAGTTNMTGELKAIQPMPMICGSGPHDKPTLYTLNSSFKCETGPEITNMTKNPQPMKLMVYRKNSVEWKTAGFQCRKYSQKVTTEMSFFTDVKTKKTSEEILDISKEECERMVKTKECSAGELFGGDGVYMTDNPVGEEYVYCCKPYEFSADQCSLVETYVYKTFGNAVFESTAGDVSHCQYSTGSCLLSDESMLVWQVDKQVECEYQEWYSLSGKYFDHHFISNDHNMALTFVNSVYGAHTNCKGEPTTISDQGLMVKFLTAFDTSTLHQSAASDAVVSELGDDMTEVAAIVNTVVEPLAISISEVTQKLFWSSYTYTCNNIAETLRLVSMLLYEHPTPSARYVFQNPAIVAKAGPGFIEVYPCTELNDTMYQFQSMPEGNCTEYLPMSVYLGGMNHTGYLDPKDNVIHRHSMTVDCELRKQVPISLGGRVYYYSWDTGSLSPADKISVAKLPGLHLGADVVTVHETIYNRAHRLNWNDFSNHRSLNDLLSTLSRQRQVLEGMGLSNDPHRSFDSNVIESKEHILGNAMFAFLFGGHVASGFELWSLAVNCVVSLMVLYIILRLVYNCARPSRSGGLVAQVTAEDGQEDSDPDDQPEAPVCTTTSAQTDRTPVTYVRDEVPPSYAPLYPKLFPSDQ